MGVPGSAAHAGATGHHRSGRGRAHGSRPKSRQAFQTPPALHRFPVSMAQRVYGLCQVIATEYGGDTTADLDRGSGREGVAAAIRRPARFRCRQGADHGRRRREAPRRAARGVGAVSPRTGPPWRTCGRSRNASSTRRRNAPSKPRFGLRPPPRRDRKRPRRGSGPRRRWRVAGAEITVFEDGGVRVVKIGPMGPYGNNAYVVRDVGGRRGGCSSTCRSTRSRCSPRSRPRAASRRSSPPTGTPITG